jgi:hypothetical protein
MALGGTLALILTHPAAEPAAKAPKAAARYKS